MRWGVRGVGREVQAVRALGEIGLIARLRTRLAQDSSVRVGIGDDAAVLHRPPSGELLFASDMLIEGVHFRRRQTPARWIGWKALAVNVSDIAAMGGCPRWAVVSLGLPPATPLRFVDELYEGLAHCARRFGMSIVGGDTVRAPQVIVDVAIVGIVARERLTRRSGARVGDALFVTGRLGGSYVSGRHARFTPRLAEAQVLLQRCHVHAMIDLSDGLASDAWQLSRASRVTLRIDAARVPVSRAARTLQHALMDGEDFELLFTIEDRESGRVPRRIRRCPVTRIGRVVRRGLGVELAHPTGRITPLRRTGFKHF